MHLHKEEEYVMLSMQITQVEGYVMDESKQKPYDTSLKSLFQEQVADETVARHYVAALEPVHVSET